MQRVIKAGACYGFLVAGCSGTGSGSVDLPRGWEAAERVERLTQAPCSSSGLADVDEVLALNAQASGLTVAYDHAHFRCAQDVEAYERRSQGVIDLLVQPIDMDPSAVAGCDCRYSISMQLSAARGVQGPTTVTLYRRWDNLNELNEPFQIGSASFEVE